MSYQLKKHLQKETPRWLVLLIDLYITLNTFLLTFWVLRWMNIAPETDFGKVITHQLPQVLIFALISFILTSSFKGIVRHTGFKDMMNVLKATILYTIMISLFSWMIYEIKTEPAFRIGKTVIVVHFLFNTIALSFLRILYKNLYNYYVTGNRYKRKVMIYGAGDSGVITYKALTADDKSKVTVMGFLDDNKKKVGKKINGIPVYNSNKISKEFIEKHNITEIVISIQNLPGAQLREIVDQFADYSVTLKIVPAVSNWLKGDLTAQQIKDIKIEDLLGRKPIKLDNEEIRNEISGKVVMVTGAAGSIGSEISRQIMNYPHKKLIMVDQAETALFNLQQTTRKFYNDSCEFVMGDVRNPERVEVMMRHYQPDIIFHAAAYKHVPLMEDNPYEAVMTNVKGTKTIADLAVKYGVEKFVMVSTDKAVNPTNVMGATKRVAELYVTQLNAKSNTKFVVTRFGNVLGSNGSVIPTFKRQIEEGGPLTVTHPDINRYFMTIPEACQLVLEAGAMGKGGEVFVFDMGESVKIFDLAKKVIQLSGLKYPEDIDIKITGLRPGEKIYEELLVDNETAIKTHHPKIMIAKVYQSVQGFEQKVMDLVFTEPTENAMEANLILVSKMKELVPEYQPSNSIYTSISNSFDFQNPK
ncbi:polysaccharide biosynthesis protein [Moheibacter sp. BDHS18]|uniref:Polysaccharide biosynthesis protein n=1 Tax=Moheibacter lacus TaxID=2745851 RepID=A0A838ZS50_9FLAO|nr:polysaccharide biosynthesis protein [Moheibacter lacus]